MWEKNDIVSRIQSVRGGKTIAGLWNVLHLRGVTSAWFEACVMFVYPLKKIALPLISVEKKILWNYLQRVSKEAQFFADFKKVHNSYSKKFPKICSPKNLFFADNSLKKLFFCSKLLPFCLTQEFCTLLKSALNCAYFDMLGGHRVTTCSARAGVLCLLVRGLSHPLCEL